MSRRSSSPIMIDLFCGAGGLSHGLSQAGFHPYAGIDFDTHSLATYHHNNPETKVFLEDVSNIKARHIMPKNMEVDLLTGGPSCQGFSTHGKRIEDDPRNFLFKEFVRLVDEIQPKFFLMENVKGLLAYSKGNFKNMIDESFEKIGYRLVSQTLCAADFGVPQMRHRIMFIGTRLKDVDLSFPEPTHGPEGSRLRPYVTVEEALSDLPLIRKKYDCRSWPYISKPQNAYQRYLRSNSGKEVSLHYANPLSEQAAILAKYIKQGQGIRAVPYQHLPDRFKKMRRLKNGELRRDCTTLYYRLDPERPSYTITCNYKNVASGPFMHPHENRSLSHREAARLMSFPDHYEFVGASFPKQIGNAVPPLMARAVGEHILELMMQNKKARQIRKAA